VTNPYLPRVAEVTDRIEETPIMFTLRLRLCDPSQRAAYSFEPGQFNMLYVYGVGEVPISISSDPAQTSSLDHTVRAVGRVTRVLTRLEPGDRLGIRGPFGRAWPMREAQGRDLVILTGGLGCAPLVAAIGYATRRRNRFRRLVIMQGVKHAADMIWRERYEDWARLPDTQVLLAADQAGEGWRGHVGFVTEVIDQARFDPHQCTVLVCGPEPMMLAGTRRLLEQGVPDGDIWLSLERNMHCGIGHCGHCQIGPRFVCQDGPVFRYRDVRWLLGTKGF
jgi:sulfhydrogenase subunit gamma (sulfur reductase)